MPCACYKLVCQALLIFPTHYHNSRTYLLRKSIRDLREVSNTPSLTSPQSFPAGVQANHRLTLRYAMFAQPFIGLCFFIRCGVDAQPHVGYGDAELAHDVGIMLDRVLFAPGRARARQNPPEARQPHLGATA